MDDKKKMVDLIIEYLKLEKLSFYTPVVNFADAETFLQNMRFDLVLIDWNLDNHKTGFELLPFIPTETKIILMSTLDEYLLKKATNENKQINAYIFKMKMSEQFIQKTKKVLGL